VVLRTRVVCRGRLSGLEQMLLQGPSAEGQKRQARRPALVMGLLACSVDVVEVDDRW